MMRSTTPRRSSSDASHEVVRLFSPVAFALVFALGACASDDANDTSREVAAALSDPFLAESQLLDLLNQARAGEGRGALVRDPAIDGLSREWATHLVVTGTFVHRPNLLADMLAVAPDGVSFGENLASANTVLDAHTGLMKSPGHYANIMGDFTRVGVGVSVRKDGSFVVAFNFAKTPNRLGPVPGPLGPVEPIGAASGFYPKAPQRLGDTREPGAWGGAISGGSIRELVLPNPNVPGALLNVAVTQPVAAGFLTIFPCGADLPLASNLNFSKGETIANAVAVAAGPSGRLCFYGSTTTHVVVDHVGDFAPGGLRYAPVSPTRLVDSRSGEGSPARPLAAGETWAIPVRGANGIDGASRAVTLNVTVTEPQADGYLTIFPCSSARPLASSLNFARGETIPNQVTSAIGAGGDVCVFSSASTQLVVDLGGHYGAGGSLYQPVRPIRVVDSRAAVGYSGKVQAGGVIEVPIAGAMGIPAGATAATLNVAVTEPSGPGFVTAYPCGEVRPNASNLNFARGETIPNLVTARLGGAGKLCLYSMTSTHIVADLAGYYVP